MIGESAGAIICAPSIQYIEQMDEKPEDYSQEDDAGLDLIDFYVLPHGGILRAVSIAPALLESAETYLKIVGGASLLNALIPIFSSYLRVFGYTKHSLIGTVVGNVINIILNSVFLFVFNWGVMGVAAATVISKAVNLIIVAAMGAVLIKAKQSPEREQPRRILAQIVKIGFPSAFETALYNVAMTFIVRFMNQMDTDGMNVTARSYAMQIANSHIVWGQHLHRQMLL